ncbi:MAG: desulfoferrodoxin [Candidatus ainarchaeum sp.]|nr:desulfoferrodoxin [Candidatus ainarchaeum sp.]
MTELTQVYKCNVCGNIVEVVHSGVGQLVCCNQPMNLLKEFSHAEEKQEKHVPFIKEKINEQHYVVQIGEVEHPMEEKHYIEWVEVIADDQVYKKFLKPGEKPIAEFKLPSKPKNKLVFREYCNLHGLWKLELDV